MRITERTILIDLKFLCYFQDNFGFVDNEADWLHIHLPFSLPPTLHQVYGFSVVFFSVDDFF